MGTTSVAGVPSELREGDLLRATFRDLHGARLHGFALLVSLGDRPRAARAVADALDAGARHVQELWHPERAAAWLRARVLRSLRGRLSRRTASEDLSRRAALRGLGADSIVYEGLAALPVDARAALVATAIERFEPIDVEAILDAPPGSSGRTVTRARARYLAAVAGSVLRLDPAERPRGALYERIHGVAERALGGSSSTGGSPGGSTGSGGSGTGER